MQIRKLIEAADLGGLLTGHIEIDEAYVGGRRPANAGAARPEKRSSWAWSSVAAESRRKSIPDIRKETLRDVVLENVVPGAVVSTDELIS